jgi:hypothetical protein
VTLLGVVGFAASLLFYLWATINSIKGGFFDYGIYCFAASSVGAIATVFAGMFNRTFYSHFAAATVVIGTNFITWAYSAANGGLMVHANYAVPTVVWVIGTALIVVLLVKSSKEADVSDDDAQLSDGAPDSFLMSLGWICLFAACTFFGLAAYNSLVRGFDVGVIVFVPAGWAGVAIIFAGHAPAVVRRNRIAEALLIFALISVATGFGLGFNFLAHHDPSTHKGLIGKWVAILASWIVGGIVTLVRLRTVRTTTSPSVYL